MRLGRKPKAKEEDDERMKTEIEEEELAFSVTIFYGKKLPCIDDIHFFQGFYLVGIWTLFNFGKFWREKLEENLQDFGFPKGPYCFMDSSKNAFLYLQ